MTGGTPVPLMELMTGGTPVPLVECVQDEEE